MFIPIELYGQRIDKILSVLLPQYSRVQLSLWLKQGIITVESQLVKAKDKFNYSAHIELPEHFPLIINDNNVHAPEEMLLDIIYEDNDLLIINKPVGLIVHPGAGNSKHTLLNGLLYHRPQLHALPRAGIVHRLDKNTSGLLLIAKTIMAYNALVRQLQAHEIQRHYYALVHGNVIGGGTIDTYFRRHPHNRLKMTVCNSGKQAITNYKLIKQYGALTLLEVTLETGRTHQIRVHMAHINHHIVGDNLYGKRMRNLLQWPGVLIDEINSFVRQALHATKLVFLHPRTRVLLTITVPIPADIAELLKLLEIYGI